MQIVSHYAVTNTTPLKNRDIKYIVVHYTAGTTSKSGSALSLARWIENGANPANPTSCDYIVDDSTIVQYNSDIKNRYSWGVGGNKYPSPSTSIGGRLYGIATNKNCINIEVCSNKKNPKSLQATDTDWYFTDAELNNLEDLIKYLMQVYSIPLDRVIMHHEVTGKLCPAMWTHSEKELDGWYKFKETIKDVEAVKQDDKVPMYYVQVGAFKSKENAEKFLDSVKMKYPNAFIKVM